MGGEPILSYWTGHSIPHNIVKLFQTPPRICKMQLKLLPPIAVMLVAVGTALYYPNVVSLVRFAVGGLLKGNMNTSRDGRETRCLEYVRQHAIQGNATDVLLKIDEFGWNEDFLMNVGDAKGEILTAAVKKKSPLHALEVGAYVGYSATRIASDLGPGGRLTSVEYSPENAAVARAMVCGSKVQSS